MCSFLAKTDFQIKHAVLVYDCDFVRFRTQEMCEPKEDNMVVVHVPFPKDVLSLDNY